MAALIEEGWTFQSNSDPAWHKEGTTFPAEADPEAAWRATGGHTIIEGKLQAVFGTETIDCNINKALFRVGEKGDIKELAHVSKGYTVVQPRKGLHQWDYLRETGLVELETGGWLQNGIFWSQARIKPAIAEVVPNDIIQGRFLLTMGFDGKHKIEMSDHKTRAVCANTIGAAKAEKKLMNFHFKHTKNVHEKLDQANMFIEAYIKAFTEEIDTYKQLTKIQLTSQNMKDYFWKVFAPEAKTDAERKAHPRIEAKISHVVDLMDAPEYVPAVRGSAWHCYNAVAHYLSHDVEKDDGKRLQSLWFGSSADTNQRAMNEAVALMN